MTRRLWYRFTQFWRRIWRDLNDLCYLCGGARIRHAGQCFHCTSNPKWCHACAKTAAFAKAYGASPATIARICTKS